MTKALLSWALGGTVLGASTLLGGSVALAQGTSSPLQEAVLVGDRVEVFGPKGDVDGRVVGLTADAIELDVDGHRERVVAVDIGWIERIGDPVLEGVFIGGGLAAALFSQLATYECSSGCGRKRAEGALWGVAIGGLVGGLIDGAGAQRRVVYGSRQPTPERALPVAAAPSTPRSEPPPLARRAERATSTADLWTVVRTDDRVTVSLVDGEQLHGRFRRACPTA